MSMYLLNKLKYEFKPVKKNNVTDNRDCHLDFLKILATFLVVFYHYAYYEMDYGFVEGVFYFPNINRVFMSFAACCVPLFFLVNGILMFSKQRIWKDVYYKAGKILFLTLIWSFIGFPSWFFKTLVILYLLFPFFQYCWNRKRWIYYSIIIAFLIMPFIYNQILVVIKMIGMSDIGSIHVGELYPTGVKTMYSIVYFLGGNVLANCKKIHPLKSLVLIGLGWSLLLIECMVYTNINQAVYDGVNASFPTLGALFLTLGLYEITSKIELKRLKGLLMFLSRGILSIYLMHVAFIRIIIEIILPTNLLLAILGTTLICLLCIVVGEVMGKVPVICCILKM